MKMSKDGRSGTLVLVSRILLVEDSEVIRASVQAALQSQGHQVKALPDGTDLETTVAGFKPELVILDVMMPGRDGFELLEVVHTISKAGVIMLTAKDGIEDRVRSLSQGADDYISKPFVMAELLARVTAVLRRSSLQGSSVEIGGLVISDNASNVTYNGNQVKLTETERRLLAELAKFPGQVVSKAQLLTSVWGYGGYDVNIVEVHIFSLRKALEKFGPRVIHTVRQRGYRLGES